MNIYNIFKNLTYSQSSRIQLVCRNKCFIDTHLKLSAILFAIFISNFNFLEAQSYRGLHVLSDSVVWVSGSKGQIFRLGNSMQWLNSSPLGFERKDFRDIHAWSHSEALAMSAGDSGVLLRTTNGGKTWTEVFKDYRRNVFFDAIDFEGSCGVLFGDPIDSTHLYTYLTQDNGKTWFKIPDGKWNSISAKLSSMYAASGSSVNIEFWINHNKNIDLGLVIGGGGEKGASIRRASLKLAIDDTKTELVLLEENFTDISIPLPEGAGWGIYAMSEIPSANLVTPRQEKFANIKHFKEYFLGGGHWQYPFADTQTVWKLTTDNKLIPMNYKGYVSGILATGNESFAAVGTNKIQSGLPSDMPVSNSIQKSKNYLWVVGKQKLFYPIKRKDYILEYNK